jgi:EmrB/QacA subfamily drug resistance transporter
MSVPHTSPRLTFAIVAIGVCSYSLLQSVSVPTMPLIQTELETDQATGSWILTAFLLSASVATPIIGRMGDSFGKRRMYVWSLAALTAGALLAAAAPNIEVMIGARVLQGLGGGTLPLAFAILRDELPKERVAGAIALTSSLLSMGFAAGIVLAGPVAETLGFRALFLLPALVAAGAAICALRMVPESPVLTREPIPLLPALLLAGWLVALLLGVSQAPSWGWTAPATIGLLGAAAVLLAAWIRVEWTARLPLVDLRLMGRRGVWTANLVALLIGIAMYASFGFIPQLTQTPSSAGYGFGASVTVAGYLMLPTAITSFLCGLVSARLADLIGMRSILVIGGLLTAVSLVMVAFVHDQPWQMCVAAGLSGLGTGLVFANLANAVVAAVPPEHTGVATGMNANIRTVGGTIGSAVMTSIVTAQTLPSGYPAEQGYINGFGFLALVALGAALAAMLIPLAPRRVAPVGRDVTYAGRSVAPVDREGTEMPCRPT